MKILGELLRLIVHRAWIVIIGVGAIVVLNALLTTPYVFAYRHTIDELCVVNGNFVPCSNPWDGTTLFQLIVLGPMFAMTLVVFLMKVRATKQQQKSMFNKSLVGWGLLVIPWLFGLIYAIYGSI